MDALKRRSKASKRWWWGVFEPASICLAILFAVIPPHPAFSLRDGLDLGEDKYSNSLGAIALIDADNSEDSNYTFKCVGVFVRVDFVLTAGHCLLGAKTNFRVMVPVDAQQSDFETIAVEDYRYHPMTDGGIEGEMYDKFELSDSGRYHDIGIMRLSVPSAYARPMSVVPADFDVSSLENSNIFIFGRQRDELFRSLDILGFARMEKPKPMPGGQNIMLARMVKDPIRGLVSACVGDSGGPVTVTAEDEENDGKYIHYIMGIYTMHSDRVLPEKLEEAKKYWGGVDKIPDCGLDVGYTNVVYEASWINAVMAEMDPDGKPRLKFYGDGQPPLENGELEHPTVCVTSDDLEVCE